MAFCLNTLQCCFSPSQLCLQLLLLSLKHMEISLVLRLQQFRTFYFERCQLALLSPFVSRESASGAACSTLLFSPWHWAGVVGACAGQQATFAEDYESFLYQSCWQSSCPSLGWQSRNFPKAAAPHCMGNPQARPKNQDLPPRTRGTGRNREVGLALQVAAEPALSAWHPTPPASRYPTEETSRTLFAATQRRCGSTASADGVGRSGRHRHCAASHGRQHP